MPASTLTQLRASPFRLTTSSGSNEQPPLLHRKIHIIPSKEIFSTLSEPFPIARLPDELRQVIYTHYFASLPTQNITCLNVRLPHHFLTPLALSSPFLAFDLTQNLFYRHATFSFSCPEALKAFSTTLASESPSPEIESAPAKMVGANPQQGKLSKQVGKRKDVRKIKILYGRYDQPTRDWVFLLTTSFPSLSEVTFSIDCEKGRLGIGDRCFGNWWGCVKDAIREELGGGARRRVRLRVEDRVCGVVEVVSV